MEAVMPMNGFMELAEEDLMAVDGGTWSTHDLGVCIGTTAAKSYIKLLFGVLTPDLI
jgi:hypothetical protein